MTLDSATVNRFLTGAMQVDWSGGLAALKSGDPMQELMLVENIAGVAAELGVPYAAWVKDAIEVLQMIEKARELGLWAPGQPEDPAMARVEVEHKFGGK